MTKPEDIQIKLANAIGEACRVLVEGFASPLEENKDVWKNIYRGKSEKELGHVHSVAEALSDVAFFCLTTLARLVILDRHEEVSQSAYAAFGIAIDFETGWYEKDGIKSANDMATHGLCVCRLIDFLASMCAATKSKEKQELGKVIMTAIGETASKAKVFLDDMTPRGEA